MRCTCLYALAPRRSRNPTINLRRFSGRIPVHRDLPFKANLIPVFTYWIEICPPSCHYSFLLTIYNDVTRLIKEPSEFKTPRLACFTRIMLTLMQSFWSLRFPRKLLLNYAAHWVLLFEVYFTTTSRFVEHVLFCRNSSWRIRMTEGSCYPDLVKLVRKRMAAKVAPIQFLDLLVARPDHWSNKMGKMLILRNSYMSPVLCCSQHWMEHWNQIW